MKRGGLRVRVSKDGQPQVTAERAGSAAALAASAARAAASTATVEYATVSAPLTGIFYRSSSPQMPPFVQVGSAVNSGDVVGLIEAMKLFNEIRSTKTGRVRRILAENGQLVRAHQPLLELEA